jgi:hypothetical protein
LITFLAIATVACDGEFAKKFDYGRPLPDVRFEVTLDNPTPRDTVYREIEKLAYEQGFTVLSGDHEARLAQKGRRSFGWRYDGDPISYSSVLFILNSDAENQTSSFELILYNNGLETLGVEDWRDFGRWRDELLPSAFPGAQVSVTRSPIQNTDPQRLEQIVAESGVQIGPN